jgi:hypothetical protein
LAFDLETSDAITLFPFDIQEGFLPGDEPAFRYLAFGKRSKSARHQYRLNRQMEIYPRPPDMKRNVESYAALLPRHLGILNLRICGALYGFGKAIDVRLLCIQSRHDFSGWMREPHPHWIFNGASEVTAAFMT